MARYTGPKTKIARKFGEAIFGEDKAFEKEIIHQGNTEIIAVVQKSLNMLFSLWRNKKQNSRMGF